MGTFRKILAVAAAALSSMPQPVLGAGAVAGPAGQWRVEHVEIDRNSGRRVSIAYDDPRSVGRYMDFSPDRILFGDVDGSSVCRAPHYSEAKLTLSEMMTGSFGATSKAFQRSDYGLPLSTIEPMTATLLKCGSGSVGKGFDGGYDSWFVNLPNHRLAMGYFDTSILVLAPATPDAKPVASFDCAKAATATEKAICGSQDLASLDRSIAASYADAVRYADGETADILKLKAGQTAWLRARNRCAADDKCLRASMNRQLLELAKDAGLP